MRDTDSQRERFEELFRDFHLAVRDYARRRVRAESVDDIVSDTFLVAWRRWEQVPDDPLPWLLTVARNSIGTELRGEARRLRLRAKARSGWVESSDRIEPGDSEGRVLSALARLSERDREALTLVVWDGLTPAEAAGVLGEPTTRFRVRLHRASRRLRSALAAEPDLSVPDPRPTSTLNVISKGSLSMTNLLNIDPETR